MVHFPSGKNLEKEYFLDMGSDNENSDEPLSSQQYWTAESLVHRIENWDLHVACERLIENSKDRKLTSITPEIYTYICAKLYDTSVRLFATAMPVSHSWQCYQTINGTTPRTINRYQKVLFFQLIVFPLEHFCSKWHTPLSLWTPGSELKFIELF